LAGVLHSRRPNPVSIEKTRALHNRRPDARSSAADGRKITGGGMSLESVRVGGRRYTGSPVDDGRRRLGHGDADTDP
jgi:hypothetical protein